MEFMKTNELAIKKAENKRYYTAEDWNNLLIINKITGQQKYIYIFFKHASAFYAPSCLFLQFDLLYFSSPPPFQ